METVEIDPKDKELLQMAARRDGRPDAHILHIIINRYISKRNLSAPDGQQQMRKGVRSA